MALATKASWAGLKIKRETVLDYYDQQVQDAGWNNAAG